MFVISGSYHEYFEFLKSKGLPRDTKEYVFFSDPMHLLSLKDVDVLCVGDYRKSPVLTHKNTKLLSDARKIRFIDQAGKMVMLPDSEVD